MQRLGRFARTSMTQEKTIKQGKIDQIMVSY